jgi:hypothetical protein
MNAWSRRDTTLHGRVRELIGLVAAIGLAGCVTVTPSQRRYLSLPEMSPATDANEDQFQAHIDNARRGSMGGRGGAAGGGCGCG